MWVYWVASLLLSAVIGGLLGRRVGKALEGVMLGVLLGPIGWVVLFFLPKGLRPQNIGYSVVVILLMILALLVINALVR